MVVDENVLSPNAFGRPKGDVVIVYDGECPFCSNFVALQSLRANARVSLIDARHHLHDVRAAKGAGLDIDRGMLVFWKARIYEGGDALNLLALLGDDSRFARLTRLFFGNETASRLAYPALRAGRNLALRLLGRKPLTKC